MDLVVLIVPRESIFTAPVANVFIVGQRDSEMVVLTVPTRNTIDLVSEARDKGTGINEIDGLVEGGEEHTGHQTDHNEQDFPLGHDRFGYCGRLGRHRHNLSSN